jgi:thiamine transport system substrate-binding protein
MKRMALAAVAAAIVGTISIAAHAAGTADSAKQVVLVTHDSFAVSKPVKAAFERQTGLKLRILQSGDAGAMLNRALLTAGRPEGDVIFGIDNNLLTRALSGNLLTAYSPATLRSVDRRYDLDRSHRLVPVDHGEVCLNTDKRWFASRGVAAPRSLDDLTRPAYKGLLVVENPATSTPGLAFLLATVARYGQNGWQAYWKRLRENRVLVTDGWEEAYTQRFSGAAGSHGNRPIVVSYASSPPAEVFYSGKKPTQAPTGVVLSSCFRQIEFAGILRGAANPSGARALVDFFLSPRFQADVPLSMFVFPVRKGVPLPDVFRRFAPAVPHPLELPAKTIGANRDRWIREWTAVVVR